MSPHPYASDPRTRTRSAERNYHETLVDVAVLWITDCAKNGWTPADLRHEFSAQIDPLLFHALSSVTHNVPDELLDHWFTGTRPGSVTSLGVGSLEKMVRQLSMLPPLRDWTVLTDPSSGEQEAEYLASLSPDQRRAHDRIQALLRKAESTTFEHEADALLEKAETLRQQYRVEVLLSGTYTDPSARQEVISTRVHLRAPWVRYQLRLLNTVSRAYSCEALLLTESGIATVFGNSEDVAHVLDLFASLNRQREHFMRTSAGAKTAQEQGETSRYRRSFMVAYASRIGALLKRAREDVLDNLTGDAPMATDTVLPVLRHRAQQSQETLARLFPHTRTMSVSATHHGGYRDGYTAAGRAHLGGDSAGITGQKMLSTCDNQGSFPA